MKTKGFISVRSYYCQLFSTRYALDPHSCGELTNIPPDISGRSRMYNHLTNCFYFIRSGDKFSYVVAQIVDACVLQKIIKRKHG